MRGDGSDGRMAPEYKSALRKRRPPRRAAVTDRHAQETLLRLGEIHALVVVAAAALRHQNCELDADIACLLQRSVANGIADQIERLSRLYSAVPRGG